MLSVAPQLPDPARLAELASPHKDLWLERLRQAWKYL